MNNLISNDTQLLSRKQFLSIIAAALGGLILSRFLFTQKNPKTTVDNSYGNNSYGNTKT